MIALPVKSIAFSGSIPSNYDRHLGPLFFEPFALDMAQRVKNLQPKNILEVACGTGRVTKLIAANLPEDAIFVASDLNPAMVGFAKNAVPPHPALRWDTMDAVSLPCACGKLDLLVSQFGVMFYSDRRAAYSEAWRALKPGGAFLFNAWDELNHNPAARLADEVIAEFFPVDTPAFYKTPFSYYDETVIRQDLAFGGFYEVRMELLQLTGFAETPEAAAKGLLQGTPVHTAIVERDADLLPEMEEVLAERLSLHFGNANLRVPLQARVVTAVKSRERAMNATGFELGEIPLS